jgi:hypothetical protein
VRGQVEVGRAHLEGGCTRGRPKWSPVGEVSKVAAGSFLAHPGCGAFTIAGRRDGAPRGGARSDGVGGNASVQVVGVVPTLYDRKASSVLSRTLILSPKRTA